MHQRVYSLLRSRNDKRVALADGRSSRARAPARCVRLARAAHQHDLHAVAFAHGVLAQTATASDTGRTS